MPASYVMSWIITIANPPGNITEDELANAFMGECEAHFGEAASVGGTIVNMGGTVGRFVDAAVTV